MIVDRKILARHAIGPHLPDTMGHIIRSVPPPRWRGKVALRQVLTPIEREGTGRAQEVYPHGLTERLRPFTATKGQRHPFHPGGKNGGKNVAEKYVTLLW